MDSEEVDMTETGAGGLVGVALLVGKVDIEVVVRLSLTSGAEALLWSSAAFMGAVSAAAGLTEAPHKSVSEGVTVLEGEIVKSVESGIVGSVGVGVAALRVTGAGGDKVSAGLSLVGVFVSPS